MTPAMIGLGVHWRDVGRGTWHFAFIGGLGLSALAAVILLLSIYFAGTAPRLPASAAALETLKTGGAWPPPVSVRSLDRGAPPTAAQASPTNVSLLPRSTDPSQEPPIDLSDLPPPERPGR